MPLSEQQQSRQTAQKQPRQVSPPPASPRTEQVRSGALVVQKDAYALHEIADRRREHAEILQPRDQRVQRFRGLHTQAKETRGR